MTNAGDEERALLKEAESARSAVRLRRPKASIPIVMLAVIVAGAVPLYQQWPLEQWATRDYDSVLLAGYFPLRYPTAIAWYWFTAAAVGFGGAALYLLTLGRRKGIRVNSRGLAATGGALFLALFAVAILLPTQFQQFMPPNLATRGMLPLVVIGIAILAWGAVLRRSDILLAGMAGVAASLVSALYDVANPILASGVAIPFEYRPAVNVAFTAAVLLAGAVGVAISERRR